MCFEQRVHGTGPYFLVRYPSYHYYKSELGAQKLTYWNLMLLKLMLLKPLAGMSRGHHR